MSHPALVTYPSRQAVRYGAWLRQLSIRLPELAVRCELAEADLAAIQALDSAYRAWLRQHVTGPAVSPTEGESLLAQARPLLKSLCHHTAFTWLDSRLLNLPRAPWPLPCPPPPRVPPPVRPVSTAGIGTAPLPVPHLSALLYPGRRVVVIWRRRRATCFELQVRRLGNEWHDLTVGGQPLLSFIDGSLAQLEQPAVWHYRGRYVGADGQPGPWSVPLKVMLTPASKGAESAPPIALPKAA